MDAETSFDQFLINRAIDTGNIELPVHEESAAVWVLEGSDRQKYKVKAADLSPSELVLVLDTRLPQGVWTKVNMRCGIVFGKVSRSTPLDNGGFRAHIQVDELLPR